MSVTVRVTGLKELNEALGNLSKSMAKATLRRVLLKAGKPIADAAIQLAPDDPATGGRDLKQSIAVGTKLSKRQARLHRRANRNDKQFAEVFVGPGPKPYAHLQEFGTVNHGPQPFMRPAWDANKGKALDIIKSELGKEIIATAKRVGKNKRKSIAEKDSAALAAQLAAEAID